MDNSIKAGAKMEQRIIIVFWIILLAFFQYDTSFAAESVKAFAQRITAKYNQEVHKEQRNFVEKMANGLSFLMTCKKSQDDPNCPGPNSSLTEEIQKIQSMYGPFKLKDFRVIRRECPCSGE